MLPEGGPQHYTSHLLTGEKSWLQEDRKQGPGMVAQAPPHLLSILEIDTMPGREGSSSVAALLGRNSVLVSTQNLSQNPELQEALFPLDTSFHIQRSKLR